ncbi:MAG: asparagine--tRNA ligase [Halanaerobiaceae bacterium]
MHYFERNKIKDILNKDISSFNNTCVLGWVRTLRTSKNIAFMEVNDGSCRKNLQVVILSPENFPLDDIATGASIHVKGYVEEVEGREQDVEMKAEELTVIGSSPDDYPLQKKSHSFEFMREVAHLRPRTETFGAINRFRSKMTAAVHKFFQERDFQYIHTPIITSGDAEGAGEMFTVTTLDHPGEEDDFSQDFFEKKTGLTVSGQLEAEALACALGDVYTFGPTFRAENSNTSRHASEFWMIEPEMAFCNLEEMMQLIEKFIKFLFRFALEEAEEEMEFFASEIAGDRKNTIEDIVDTSFTHLTYTEAIDVLQNSDREFEFPVAWGKDLQSEHERFLTENYFQKPVMVSDYPSKLKAFYMYLNDDKKTVRAVDCLVPHVGEIIGGSQREERYDILKERMKKQNLNLEEYGWFLDLRKYGTVPHSGFGLGFERLLMYLSGIDNIRDVIPFPRTPGNAKF